ncbi:DNA polymerase III subunit epsilon [Acidimangrovimonas sediminis]|uniref:DNA polymerase III subunit epsilon n=1 Tax=Acidimangrovimonas sediminis TaxID=2056283 RepID=UPI000C803D88|nr:DNA polymerase III subunit epsilon [Acidimangrovimonas sediminis]
MREIVLDTETTGFNHQVDDRMVEIGCVELLNHLPTGRTFHKYINPQRDMPDGAFQVHGLSAEFLSDKPVFAQIADEFLEFIGDAKLVIHNAGFDVPFLNSELRRLNLPPIPMEQAVDTLLIARRRFPGAGNSLDSLCRRFGIDNSQREKDGHGALLDSEILAKVYLELVGGRQPDFGLNAVQETAGPGAAAEAWRPKLRPTPLPSRITDEEAAAHAAFVDKLGDGAIWKKFA